MSSSAWYVVLVAVVAAERIAELAVSARHLAWAKARGGVESGRAHYPFMAVVHTLLLISCVVEVLAADRPFVPWLGWPMLAVVAGTQALRWWCIKTLGPQWNTRIVVVPGLPLVTGGPYRWLRHPNYVAVVVEIAALPLVHTAWVTALVFSALNVVILSIRIPAEQRALVAAVSAGSAHVDVDIAIAGGGPVGLACAIEAALRGRSVAVIEPRSGPVDKACGEGLMPGAVSALRRLGVEPAGAPFAGIAYVGGRSVARHRFHDGPGLGVRRTVLHDALSRRADELGVIRVEGRVDVVRQDAEGVDVAGLRSHWLLACDGLHSLVRRELGLEAAVRGPRRYGVRRHLRVAPWSEFVEVHWSPRAEAYVTPVSDDEVGVALLSAGGGSFDELLAQVPTLQHRLDGLPWVTSARGAGPLRQRSTARVHGRVLLVGDAAGYVDALTGEGIRIGLACAQAAVDAIETGQPAAYERSWRRLTRSYRILTSGLVLATRPALVRRHVAGAAALLPPVFARAVETLAG